MKTHLFSTENFDYHKIIVFMCLFHGYKFLLYSVPEHIYNIYFEWCLLIEVFYNEPHYLSRLS